MIGIILNILKESLMAMVGKLAFKAISERFMTRLVIYGLLKLKDMSTNDVVDNTVQDIVDQLKGKKLTVADNS